jgi:hypothetical protein
MVTSGIAQADDGTDAKISALQKQIDAMQKQVDTLKDQQKKSDPPAVGANGAALPVAQAPRPTPTPLLTLAPGNNVTLLIGGKERVQVYGSLDVSADYATRGLQNFYPFSGDTPEGNMGWQPFLSTNSTTIGVRGDHPLGPKSGFIYQVASGINITQESGLSESSSAQSASVSSGLGSQATYVGLRTPVGTLRFGKMAAPYSSATARLNPFGGQPGSYGVIMGNSGGDNRVEFQTTMFHAFNFTTPAYQGWQGSFLVSPGQTRSYENQIYAAGEPNCNGGNIVGSGAGFPVCSDGAWGSVYSGSLSLTKRNFYFAGAYEVHKAVNRSGDLPVFDAGDIADETATAAAFQYSFSRSTRIGAMYETLHRYVPARLQYQNERTRDGFWVTGTQAINSRDTFDIGWARANPTPGDPGTHNTPGGANPDNMSNMVTADFKHRIDSHLSTYFAWAMTNNHPDAHFDLGAGAHGIKQDCHDASPQTAVDLTSSPLALANTGPHCYAGGQLRAFSLGLRLTF